MMSRSDLQFLDHCALAAMQALISRGSLTAHPHAMIADEAYRMAEAMISSTRRATLQQDARANDKK
jgi:hypothetical protein